jgi:hypothetical protein
MAEIDELKSIVSLLTIMNSRLLRIMVRVCKIEGVETSKLDADEDLDSKLKATEVTPK